MNPTAYQGSNSYQHLFWNLVLFTVVFFLITIALTALVIIPKFSDALESQNDLNKSVDLALKAKLFINFVDSQKITLQDLASFPSLANAVMLSDANKPELADIFDNAVIGGEKGRMILQDIAGSTLIKTPHNFEGTYGDTEAWIEKVITGSIPYYFELLGQTGGTFRFQMSVPVLYNTHIEGVLSAEITVPLEHVFITQSFNRQVAYKVTSDNTSISTDSSHIEIANEMSLEIEEPNVTFTYITDDAVLRDKEYQLRKTILSVLLIGLAISFILFALYGYRTQSISEKSSHIPRMIFSSYTIPISVAVIGVVGSIIAFSIIHNIQKTSLAKLNITINTGYVNLIRENLKINLHVLNSLKAYYDASKNIDRQDFRTFTAPLLSNHTAIQSLRWLPNVPNALRNEHEIQARSNGFSDYVIQDLDSSGLFQTAPQRERYFPVYYVEPMPVDDTSLGHDMYSDTTQFEALRKSGKGGNIGATAPTSNLTDLKENISVFYPIYATNTIDDFPETDRIASTRGFVVLELNISDMLMDTFENNTISESISIQDVSVPDKPEIIFGVDITPEDIGFKNSINLAGRTWLISSFVNLSDSAILWRSWLVLATGLILSALTTMGLIHLIRRREIVETLVKERTADLNMLSSIVSNSNDIFIVTEANNLTFESGGPKITYVNEAFSRQTGYSYEEAVGNTPRMLQGEKTDRKQLEKIQNSLADGESYIGELINYKKNGEAYWVDLNIKPLMDKTGKILQFTAVERDITYRKKSEKERDRLIDKLSDSNEELARFAYVCSHDLQEPLRMIHSFSEKLQEHLNGDLIHDEQGKKYFRFVTDGVTRAQNLIGDILAYSSVDSDTNNSESVDCQELIDDIKQTMTDALQNCEGAITSDKIPDIQGNKTQLYQLFQNLINNAIKYRKPDTPLRIHISVEDSESYWQFAIKDNGIGMEQRHLSKIFDVFQRLHGKNSSSGSGVGLSICKKVVTRQGGRIWAESELGIGSTFYFTLLKQNILEISNENRRKAS